MEYRFSGFILNTRTRELRQEGEPVDLEPRSLDLLVYLLEHRDAAVSKDELQDEVWGTIVSESAVSRAVFKLRKALGDTDESVIKTVPRFGYRFVAAVEGGARPDAEPTRKPMFWAALVALVIAAAVLYLASTVDQAGDPAAADGRKSIAVLPFVPMSTAKDDEYFADGLTEEILNSLTQIPELLVTARTSAFYFKGIDVPIPEIAETLGVDHVVEGSIRRDDDDVRITAQLIRAADGFHLWSHTYDRPADNVLQTQAEIAEQIAAALDIVLDDERRRVMQQTGLRNAEAYIPFQKGNDLYDRAHGHADRDGMLGQANEYFKKTIELAPNFWRAYEFHADRYMHYIVAAAYTEGHAAYPEHRLDEAAQSLRRDLENAARLAPDESTRASVAVTLGLLTGQWRGIGGRLELVATRRHCEVNSWFSVVAQPFGMADLAAEIYGQLRECDPLDWSGWQDGIQSEIWLGNPDAAVELAEEGMQHAPINPVEEAAILALTAAGRFDDADRFIDVHEIDAHRAKRLRLNVASARGDAGLANELLDEYFAEPGSGAHLYLAYLAQLGHRDRANALAAEIDARPFGYLGLVTNVYFCFCGAPFDIENTPNFAAVLDEAGLAWPPPSPIHWPLKDW